MITNPRVFNEEYVPESLPARHAERQQLSRALAPAEDGNRPNDVLLHGPSGVGKTVTARFMADKLREAAGVPYTRIGCVSASETAILYQAITGHPRDSAVHRNAPVDRLLSILRDLATDPYILILDEADTLPDRDILQLLSRVPLVSVIVICHDPEEWIARLDESERTRFPMDQQIELERYDTDELTSILQRRRKHGLLHGVVSDNQLHRIANQTAGIARYAIQSLRAAAELAEEREHDEVLDEDVAESFARAKAAIRRQNLRSLSFGHHVVYELVRQAEEIKAADLQEQYDAVAPQLYQDRQRDPVSDRQVRNYLEKLIEYDLVGYEGETRWRTYHVRDPSLEAPIQLPPSISERISR
jgi:Cdc6-like AAA superfamily ATPase